MHDTGDPEPSPHPHGRSGLCGANDGPNERISPARDSVG